MHNKQFGNMPGEVLLLGRSARLYDSNSIERLCLIAATSQSRQTVMGQLKRRHSEQKQNDRTANNKTRNTRRL